MLNIQYSNFIAKLIPLHIVCSYFLTKMAKLRSYDRNCMTAKPKVFAFGLHVEKVC